MLGSVVLHRVVGNAYRWLAIAPLISRYFIYISTFIGTKTCAINGQNGCISWNICRMWYCCEFISILQELGGIEEESGIKKHPHDPCSTSHGPYKLPLDRLHDHMSNRVNTQAHGPCDTLHGPCQTVPESSFWFGKKFYWRKVVLLAI